MNPPPEEHMFCQGVNLIIIHVYDYSSTIWEAVWERVNDNTRLTVLSLIYRCLNRGSLGLNEPEYVRYATRENRERCVRCSMSRVHTPREDSQATRETSLSSSRVACVFNQGVISRYKADNAGILGILQNRVLASEQHKADNFLKLCDFTKSNDIPIHKTHMLFIILI